MPGIDSSDEISRGALALLDQAAAIDARGPRPDPWTWVRRQLKDTGVGLLLIDGSRGHVHLAYDCTLQLGAPDRESTMWAIARDWPNESPSASDGVRGTKLPREERIL